MTFGNSPIIILHEFVEDEAARAIEETGRLVRRGELKEDDATRIRLTWRAIYYWFTGNQSYLDAWMWACCENERTDYLVNSIKLMLDDAEKAWAKRGIEGPPTHDIIYDDIWQDWFRVRGYRRLHQRALELHQPGRTYEAAHRHRAWLAGRIPPNNIRSIAGRR